MYLSFPETRNSLILRLSDRQDVEAWDQFVQIYQPLIYRMGRAKRLQDADARDFTQEVLISVSKAVDRWEPNLSRGRFRDWLFRIARNLMVNVLTRRKYRGIGSGDQQLDELLSKQFEGATPESAEFDLEWRRELFRWAAEQVRDQVKESTWRAFWLTSVTARSCQDAADELRISVGAVHIARSRVLGRLRQLVIEFDADSLSETLFSKGGSDVRAD